MSRPAARIVYAGFATPRHSGGVQVLTDHVRLLRDAGRDAWLWLPGVGERPGWLDPTTPILAADTLPVGAGDLTVFPEVPLIPGVDPAPGGRAVIFNQNHFYTFAADPADPAPGPPYPGWVQPPEVWSVSAESCAVLSALLPNLQVTLVPNAVDGDLFRPRPGPPLITWFSRKRPREAAILRRLFAADQRFAGVGVRELSGVDRTEVAEILGDTTVFVALSHSDGFGLPVAEALAAGCLVVGYSGGGGDELFDQLGTWRVPSQRPLWLLDRVAYALGRSDGAELAAANRTWVLDRYSAARTAAALIPAVDAALLGPGSATTAVHPARWLDRLEPNWTLFA